MRHTLLNLSLRFQPSNRSVIMRSGENRRTLRSDLSRFLDIASY